MEYLQRQGDYWACPVCNYRVAVEQVPERIKRVAHTCAPALTPEQKHQQRLRKRQLHRELLDSVDKLGIDQDQINHWLEHLKRWIAAGRPVRTEEQMEACLTVCHAPCEHFKKGRKRKESEEKPDWFKGIVVKLSAWYKRDGYCAKCGCKLSRSKRAVFNAVRMATYDCSQGFWPKS